MPNWARLKIRQNATYSLSIRQSSGQEPCPHEEEASTEKAVLRKSFAANLRAAREAQGLSQEALAHDAGLHRTYIGSVERGERNVSIDNIERLARALGLEPADLMRPRYRDT